MFSCAEGYNHEGLTGKHEGVTPETDCLRGPAFFVSAKGKFDLERDEHGNWFAEPRARDKAELFGGLDRFADRLDVLLELRIFYYQRWRDLEHHEIVAADLTEYSMIAE